MPTRRFQLKYGTGEVAFDLPASQVYFEVMGRDYPPIADISKAARAAMEQPIDAPPLRELLKPADRVAIAVSDITRGWQRMDLILPHLVETINFAGVPDKNITILLAVGGHRLNSREEIAQLCGREVAERIKVVNHDAHDLQNMVYLGKTSRGTEVSLNRIAVEADKLILTGGIVYHYMVGYGGGRKSVIPGISSIKTIQQNHLWALGPTLGSGANPNSISGKTRGNECHEDMMEVAGFAQPDFILNVVPNPAGEIAAIFGGNWISAWQEGAKLIDQIYASPIPGKADIVIASAGGFPRDINLYQAGKTMDNAYWAVKDGGAVIIIAECRDILEPLEFSEWFEYQSKLEIERALRQNFTIPGWVAWKELECTGRASCIFMTRPENSNFLRKANMIPTTGMDEALAVAYRLCGSNDPSITIMPHGANTLPILNQTL
ncbi:MAG: nickel-dependent lactate racemase [Smithellaceae bacterium]|nr:nickel-dependent lactate racemase [Smithellaceae bacterium]